MELLEDAYIRENYAISIFTTAMGDIIVWENGQLLLLNYRSH
nr:hypothetical protein [Bacillus solimangrovi]